MKFLHTADKSHYLHMSTAELRKTFLLDDLFRAGQLQLVYVDLERTVIGSAVPLMSPLPLPCPEDLRAVSFTERREIGIFNIGGPGSVQVDAELYALNRLDALYIGKGKRDISFSSDRADTPAEFYLVSYPAHAAYPTELIRRGGEISVPIGAAETANTRRVTKLIHLEGVASCQLVMGFTALESGSVWNTMPPHTHLRRSEIYLYYDVPAEHRIVHLMGPPEETRNLIVANKQVVISPGWSIHTGVGTSSYSFCWAMGGENQLYSDMDAVQASDIL